MTTSASTARLRMTLVWYLALIAAAGLNDAPVRPPWVGAVFDATALLAVGAAILGRIWCSVFIAGRKDAELVTEGPYALCRHPLYALSLLGGAGLGLATHSLTLCGATLAILGLLFMRAAAAEDAVLAQLAGERYEAWKRTTPAFLPAFGRTRVPSSLQVYPPILWKAFVDGGAFMLLLAGVMLARALHAAGHLPTIWLLQ
jgi:protein-S-isoprenylcysteine O-methyltransferase Ste14